MRERILYNSGRAGPSNGTFSKGKQYNYITWYRVRKGPGHYGYKLNLLLAATFWSSRQTWPFADGAKILPSPF